MLLVWHNKSSPGLHISALYLQHTNYGSLHRMHAVCIGGRGGWDPAFAKLMGPSTKRRKLDASQTQAAALPLNGVCWLLPLSLLPLVALRRNMGYAPCLLPQGVDCFAQNRDIELKGMQLRLHTMNV